ncbi:uncharacterized protein G2W53_007556 [Senna tora]|uniref:Uncharacterized protein n=1 Tax=Senna tora TaxID=362788 RepID=A0A834X7G5_9FABA|nr:uncharacterized protein G2W53_007556 [Senna tora]
MLMCYWRRNKVLPSNLKMSPKIYFVVNLGARTYRCEFHHLLQEEIDKRLAAANATLKKTIDEQKEVNASLKQTVDEQKEVIAGYKDKFEEYDRLFRQLFSKLQGDQGTPKDN